MPSLNRPNAPDRLPSEDFGDLFFKPRVSEARSSVTTPSPLSTPIHPIVHRRAFRSSEGAKTHVPSPLASPAVVTSQRRPRLGRSERSAYWSENSDKSGISQSSSRDSPGASEVIEEELLSLKHRTTSATSSFENRAQKVSSTATRRDPSITTNDDHASHEARADSKWTRDFLGGRLEIRVGKNKGSDEKELKEESEILPNDFSPPPSTKASTIHLPLSHTTTAGESAGHASGQPLLPETPDSFDSGSDLIVFREGLYCRTKRALGLKHGPISPYIQPRTRTPTGAVLDRVTSTLRFIPERAFSVSSTAASSVSNLSIAAPRKRRRLPGHRSGWSASSSVRDLMMGRPPAGTPAPEAMYIGSDSHQYLSVDITQPDSPAFLPSEARRINTPPLPAEGSGKSYARGFFFDYNAQDKPDREGFSRGVPSTAGSVAYGKQKDWYRVKLDAIETGVGASRVELESNVPEHFPNSPLCPRNPKHNSGGTGTCPYHGRNKSTPSDKEKTPTSSKPGTPSSVPENWWMI